MSKPLNAEQQDRLTELLDGIKEAFWEALEQQTKLAQEDEGPGYTLTELMAVVALASAQLVASVWCAVNPDLNGRERAPQYQAEMLKFVDMVRMTIEAITSPDDQSRSA
jgi:hypothetical protein